MNPGARGLARGLAIALALSSSACVVKVNEGGSDAATPTSSDPKADPDPEPETKPEASFVEAEAPVEPPREDAELPLCPPEPGPDHYCTDAGKLAGRWQPVDRVHIPSDAAIVFELEQPDVQKQPGLRIAIVGDSLYIRKVSCGACARVMGEGFSGQLSVLSETQLRALQVRLGLRPDAPVLDSLAAWQRFAADADGQAQLRALVQPPP